MMPQKVPSWWQELVSKEEQIVVRCGFQMVYSWLKMKTCMFQKVVKISPFPPPLLFLRTFVNCIKEKALKMSISLFVHPFNQSFMHVQTFDKLFTKLPIQPSKFNFSKTRLTGTCCNSENTNTTFPFGVKSKLCNF